jgi:hypothetical protein
LKYGRKTRILLTAAFLPLSIVAPAQSGKPLSKSLALPAPAVQFAGEAGYATSSLRPQPNGAGYSFAAADAGLAEWAPMSSVPGGRVEYASQGIRLNFGPLFAAMNRPAPQPGDPSEEEPGRYSVKGLLWQSLAFDGVEDGYRLATDHYLRHLVADGPYWHNYMASMQHWDMTRWSDGDDFLVDDIGHPMQGAVSAFIEIQNSPSQRELRLSMAKAYWHSRLLALMWATVFRARLPSATTADLLTLPAANSTAPQFRGSLSRIPTTRAGPTSS